MKPCRNGNDIAFGPGIPALSKAASGIKTNEARRRSALHLVRPDLLMQLVRAQSGVNLVGFNPHQLLGLRVMLLPQHAQELWRRHQCNFTEVT